MEMIRFPVLLIYYHTFFVYIVGFVPSNPNIDDAAVAVFFGVLIFLLIMAIPVAIFLIYKRNHLLVRRNTPNVSLLMLLGLILSDIGVILLCLGAYDWSCNIFLFMFLVGQSLVIGGLIAKNYRIYKIFQNKSAAPVILTDFHLFLIIGAITFYFVLLYIFSMIVGSGAYTFQSSSNPFYFYIECANESTFWSALIEILTNVSLLILRIAAICIAILTRKVSMSFSESRQILIILTIYICIDIAIAPLYYTLRGGTDSASFRLILRTIQAVISLASTLIILFYYRMYLVYRYDKSRSRRVNQQTQ